MKFLLILVSLAFAKERLAQLDKPDWACTKEDPCKVVNTIVVSSTQAWIDSHPAMFFKRQERKIDAKGSYDGARFISKSTFTVVPISEGSLGTGIERAE